MDLKDHITNHLSCHNLLLHCCFTRDPRTTMKIFSGAVLALLFLVCETAAFSVTSLAPRASSVVLRSSEEPSEPSPPEKAASSDASSSSSSQAASTSKALTPVSKASPVESAQMFDPSLFQNLKRVDGEGSILTFEMPPNADRVQMFLTTNGRPLKAQVQLWLGPLRNTHTMEIDVMDGYKTPFLTTLKFKKGGPTLRITTKNADFPVMAGVQVLSTERSEQLEAITKKVWAENPKTLIQGGPIDGGKGAVRTFPVAPNVKSVQVIFWSNDTGKKSLKAKIEILQGPNSSKEVYDLQCGGGSQPYHAVFEIPGGQGGTIRIYNKKYVEDGLFECAVVPYTWTGDAPPKVAPSSNANMNIGGSWSDSSSSVGGKQWWQ